MVALRKEFDEVFLNGPPAPPASTPGAEGKAAVDEFNRALKSFRIAMMKQRRGMLDALAGIEESLEEATDLGEHVVREHIEKRMPLALQALDMAIERGKREFVIAPQTRQNLKIAALIDPGLRQSVDAATFSFERAVAAYLDSLRDARERVQTMVWDFDPDARGGETFDNVDDLLASLSA